jgi:TonB family protein
MSAPAERLKMTEAWKQWEGEVVDGRFPLRRFLGGSDHSVVFLTEFGQPLQRAALKFVEANPATSAGLLSRWESASNLSHPHLIRVVHSGRCQLGRASMLYVVTELAEESLSQILPSRPLTPSEAEYMLRSVLEVLAYLHGQGLVHGHVKPANVMAVGEELKISSDGVCRRGEKALAGPPTIYDPPELATAGLSPPGDVWSLGITLVEALTQRPSVGEGIRQADPLLPDTVPTPFLEIARQCLRLDPERRWTVPDIAARLLPTLPTPGRSPWSRYWLPVAAVAVAIVALIAGPRFLNRGAEPASSLPNEIQEVRVSPKAESPVATPPTTTPSRTNTDAQALENSAKQIPQPTAPSPPPPASSTAAPVSGAVAQQVLPPVPHRSRETITGKVHVGVRVAVNPSGDVVHAQLDSPGPSAYFAKLALESSRGWKFSPPQVSGAPVPSEWVLRYEFGRVTTEVYPAQVSPRQ